MPLDPEKKAELNKLIDSFKRELRNLTLERAHDIALRTLDLLMRITGVYKWSNARELMDIVKTEGKRLMQADKTELIIGNIVRRYLKIIREEYASAARGEANEDAANQESLHTMLMPDGHVDDFTIPIPDFKGFMITALNELKSELENSVDNIAAQALEHIHTDEILLTIGYSETVEAFLKNAAKKRKFDVYVAECAPSLSGHKMALKLAEANISTTLMPDTNIFAIMKRVNKVIIGTHTIMADGGLKAIIGSSIVTQAALFYKVPVIVCASIYKLSTEYWQKDIYNKFLSPQDVLGAECSDLAHKVHVVNPKFDHVLPDHVDLFILNIGGHAPSYIYRLLTEYYHSDDREL